MDHYDWCGGSFLSSHCFDKFSKFEFEYSVDFHCCWTVWLPNQAIKKSRMNKYLNHGLPSSRHESTWNEQLNTSLIWNLRKLGDWKRERENEGANIEGKI